MKWRQGIALAVLALSLPTAALAAEAPAVSASAAILVDGDSGRVLYAKNEQDERAIASITKIMTALVAIESTEDLDQVFQVPAQAVGAEGSSMYLRSGEEITMRELLYGLMLSSGNDAALAVAICCAGDVDTFVDWMNQRAASLDMLHTHFVNPNGLSQEEHYSSAEDMAKLAVEAMRNETLAEIVSTKSITLGTRTLVNHNKLLTMYEYAVGMKTGYTKAAGRTLVSCGEKDGQRMIVVTLNDPDDWNDHIALLEYGFENWPSWMLCTADKEVAQVKVSGGTAAEVSVYTQTQFCCALGEEDQVTAKIVLPEQVSAPVSEGAIAGELQFYLDGELIGRSYLVFGSSVEKAERPSFLERLSSLLGRGKTG